MWNNMYKDLLPIGTIVKIKGTARNMMICGRIVAKNDENTIYDY